MQLLAPHLPRTCPISRGNHRNNISEVLLGDRSVDGVSVVNWRFGTRILYLLAPLSDSDSFYVIGKGCASQRGKVVLRVGKHAFGMVMYVNVLAVYVL